MGGLEADLGTHGPKVACAPRAVQGFPRRILVSDVVITDRCWGFPKGGNAVVLFSCWVVAPGAVLCVRWWFLVVFFVLWKHTGGRGLYKLEFLHFLAPEFFRFIISPTQNIPPPRYGGHGRHGRHEVCRM